MYRLLTFEKCSSQDISTVTKNPFNIYPKIFHHILSFGEKITYLYKFGYGHKLIHMIQVAYTNMDSKIKINCLLSNPLMLVLQECLLSMLLYNIVAEVLENFTKADNRIKGIQIGNHEIKTVKFTDNATITLRDITCLNSI